MHRLTPNQIRKAIYGETTANKIVSGKKLGDQRPEQAKKPRVQPAPALSSIYTNNQLACVCPVPDWFAHPGEADVSVIVPLHGNLEWVESFADTWDTSQIYKTELIFVDDACPLDSKSHLIQSFEKRNLKSVGRIYWSSIRQGWNASCNIGAFHARGQYLIFIHPSLKPGAGWMRSLLRGLRKPEVAACCSMIIRSGEIIDAGTEWSWDAGTFLARGSEIYHGSKLPRPFSSVNLSRDIAEANEVESLRIGCTAVRRKDFLEQGGFCPYIRSGHWGLADFSLSAREQGRRIICQSSSVMNGQAISEEKKDEETGRAFFFNKWVYSKRIDKLVSGKREVKPIKTILVQRTASAGDVLLAAGIAPAIKRKHPKSSIIFRTDFPELLQNNPWIDRIVTGDDKLSQREYQYGIDLDMSYEYRPNLSILEAYAQAAGVNVEEMEFFLDAEEVKLPFQEFVVMHAGKTMWTGRNWSSYKFDMVSKRLKEKSQNIICVGCQSDHFPAFCDLDLRDKTNFHQLAFLIKSGKFLIGIDSFPMHIAQVFDIPAVCFFGSVNPKTRLFKACVKPVVANGLECLGCHHRNPTPCVSTFSCERGTQDCCNDVTTDQMWSVVEPLMLGNT